MTELINDREAVWHYLCSLRDIGPVTIGRLLEYTGELMEVPQLSYEQLEKSGIMNKSMLAEWKRTEYIRNSIREYYVETLKKGYKFYSCEHEQYPDRLKNIANAPYGIWLRGSLPASEVGSAAIIGSRVCTDYGKSVAYQLGEKLAEWGIDVISGMALGIDASGQWGALKAGGYSLGVLGCGVDICYPMQNIDLFERLKLSGGVLSEYAPGMPGMPNNFRQRNRLISGLADCVIVVEAKEKSGTQVTVSWALDQGKEIYAVPGRITDKYSKGCNELIAQGANILSNLSVLRNYFNIEDSGNKSTKTAELSELDMKILENLTDEMQHVEKLIIKLNVQTGIIIKSLIKLEEMGLIAQPVKNYYKKNPIF